MRFGRFWSDDLRIQRCYEFLICPPLVRILSGFLNPREEGWMNRAELQREIKMRKFEETFAGWNGGPYLQGYLQDRVLYRRIC